jgi:hypothetical protein
MNKSNGIYATNLSPKTAKQPVNDVKECKANVKTPI